MRHDGRSFNTLRPVSFTLNASKYAEGSCLVRFGDTHVLCTASVEEKLPIWRRGARAGWLTAEYGMLPRATLSRNARDSMRGKPSGRSLEIQRFIGRSLRAALDLHKLGERQIILDCDVLQADGGTRTAAVTGGWVALKLACHFLVEEGLINHDPVIEQVAAISCGMVRGTPCLDLDYEEDSQATADANFTMTASGGFVDIQATSEGKLIQPDDFSVLTRLATEGIEELFSLQKKALEESAKTPA